VKARSLKSGSLDRNQGVSRVILSRNCRGGSIPCLSQVWWLQTFLTMAAIFKASVFKSLSILSSRSLCIVKFPHLPLYKNTCDWGAWVAQMLNWWSHPGAPWGAPYFVFLSKKIQSSKIQMISVTAWIVVPPPPTLNSPPLPQSRTWSKYLRVP